MKKFLKIYIQLFGWMVMLGVSCMGCDSYEPSTGGDGNGAPIQIDLNIGRLSFDGETRAAEANWKSGDKIYLYFTTDNSTTTNGVATYDGEKWTVSYYGPLTNGTNLRVKCCYVENPAGDSKPLISCDSNTIIYQDNAGIYSFNGTTLSILAKLTPSTGRLRFRGEPQQTLTVSGITTYSSYNYESDKTTTVTKSIKLTVGEDGYTPYVYGMFAGSDTPRLDIETDNYWAAREVASDIFQPGVSGYLSIPTADNCNGWFFNKIESVRVSGTIIPMMQITGEDGGLYYVSQTEVTEEQYCSIMDSNPSNLNCPVKTTYNDAVAFASKLSEESGRKFRVINEKEWLWVRKGGYNSRKYVYAGGNDVYRVAWFSLNSNGQLQPVKQKLPNELGVYDMSGNIDEFATGLGIHSGYFLNYGGRYNSDRFLMCSEGYENGCSIASDGGKTAFMSGIRLYMEP